MKDIAIFGGGGFGREVQMLIEQINKVNPVWNFIGFFDDGLEKQSFVNNAPVLGGITELNEYPLNLDIVFAIGNPVTKKNIVSKINNRKTSFPVLIHPNVFLGSPNFVSIGDGSIITAGTIITVNIKIGKHVILNLGCTVGHDTVIGDYSSFMPSVNISGEVTVKDCVYVGTGAKIINQLEIGENSVIGAGAVVTKTIPPNCTAVGIPAKPNKFHE
jgi:sugar O-acyltransferase (sialic acid O-acetyltransferase NeuD family)